MSAPHVGDCCGEEIRQTGKIAQYCSRCPGCVLQMLRYGTRMGPCPHCPESAPVYADARIRLLAEPTLTTSYGTG